MFFLRDLPDNQTLREFADRYPQMDISAVKTCLVLLRAGSDLLAGFEAMLARHGLSQGRFLTLIVLNRTPNRTVNPSVLADKVGVTRATMTGLLDGLEKEGLVERLAQPGDRRKLGILLTGAGRRILENMLPDYYQRIAKLMAGLSETEREQLIVLLAKVSSGLSALSREVI
jgi:MarR family transcriptional regulator, negative regulator of the multidrug operon emrRAB